MGVNIIFYIGFFIINGIGVEFIDGDIVVIVFGGSVIILVGGIVVVVNVFVFLIIIVGGVYDYVQNGLEIFVDCVYCFDVFDFFMIGRDFKLFIIVNGEWGFDGVIGGDFFDDGIEYIINKIINGIVGSVSVYV